MSVCPRCEQGHVVEVCVLNSETHLFVCNECEAAWPTSASIGSTDWQDFGKYLGAMGRSPSWNEVAIVEHP